jgi:glycosyltransferase involved in cell wall biosynthesis
VQLPPNELQAWSETMLALLDDAARRASMVTRGFLQARQFTWARAAQQLSSLYAQLLNESGA